MVIQRLQSLWLLFASVLMGLFCFMPMFLVVDDSAPEHQFIMPADMPVFMTVSAAVALLLFIAIFLFKNTRRQKTVTLVSIFLIVACCVAEVCVYMGFGGIDAPLRWQGSAFLLVGALLFAVMAYRGIRKDENLLRAADRLR